MTLHFSKLLLLTGISLLLVMPFHSMAQANEKIPNDVRYMLEDMYGANKNEWPSPIYKKDLNKDGFSDWVAINKNCTLKKDCPGEVFICVPGNNGACSEYCYSEVKSIRNIASKLKTLKCESTC